MFNLVTILSLHIRLIIFRLSKNERQSQTEVMEGRDGRKGGTKKMSDGETERSKFDQEREPALTYKFKMIKQLCQLKY